MEGLVELATRLVGWLRVEPHRVDNELEASLGVGERRLRVRLWSRQGWIGCGVARHCVETMDHSWGPRPEMEMRSGSWMHAHFGEDLAIHWITSLKLDAPANSAARLRHGYVMQDGKVYGLTDLVLEVNRAQGMPMSIDVVATGMRGVVTRMHGATIACGPWSPYTSTVLTAALMRWTLDDGRIGSGVVQENIANRQLNRLHARRWLDPLSVGSL